MIRILFLAANPTDTTKLRVGEESRAIDEALRKSEYRDEFQIEKHFAVRVGDVTNLLLRYQPDIVHFSGHGSDQSEILLEDEAGNSQPVPVQALGRLFSVLKDNIRCVVLNACYSEPQAKAIAEHIDCVVGMSDVISDNAALNFASAFYQALGDGRSIQTAFDLGCLQIDWESLGEQNPPQLLARKSNPSEVVLVRVEGSPSFPAIVSLNGTTSSYHDLALVRMPPPMYVSDSEPTILVLKGSMPIRRYNLKKGDSIIPQTEFLHVEFLNNRARKAGVPNARKIRAWITFFSAQTKRITHDFPGRWEGIEPKYDEISTWEGTEKFKDLLEVDIPSDGFTKQRLNIAVRFANASFAFNNDWYKMISAEVFALPEKQYYVSVQLAGENIVHSEYWLELITGENETILTPLEKPVDISKETFKHNIEETFTNRENFLGVFEKAMQKPSKRKRKKG